MCGEAMTRQGRGCSPQRGLLAGLAGGWGLGTGILGGPPTDSLISRVHCARMVCTNNVIYADRRVSCGGVWELGRHQAEGDGGSRPQGTLRVLSL